MAGVLNDLGQSIIPSVFGSLNGVGLVDTMNIVSSAVTTGTGGGQIKSASVNDYQNVPCAYEPDRVGSRKDAAGKLLSQQPYTLTFPTHHNGTRINIDPAKHLLSVIARGNEPAKVFRILSIRDDAGVVFEATCIREN